MWVIEDFPNAQERDKPPPQERISLSRLLRRDRVALFFLFLFYWTVFFLVARPVVFGDAVHYLLFFPGLFSDGNFNLADEYSRFPSGSPLAEMYLVTSQGYAKDPYPFGTGLLALPFTGTAFLIDHWTGSFVRTGQDDLIGIPYRIAITLSAGFYGWLGVFFSWLGYRKIVGRRST